MSSKIDFRRMIQQEFVSRCRKNPRYSLRAFAKALGVAPSPLSAILRGRRPISAKMKLRLGSALGYSSEQLSRFDDDTSSVSVQQLALDQYAVIADWYHYAVLELTKIKGFKSEVDYIAKMLRISIGDAQNAVDRLKRLGLLEEKRGRLVDKSAGVILSNIHEEKTTQANRILQAQVLEKALRALEEVPIESRNHTSMTMAIHPKKLPEAKRKIQNFRRELCRFLESSSEPTHVYHLGITLYPVSKA